MSAIERMAEERIREAIGRGELDDLPGAGRPLALDDDAPVPEELRAAFRLLRNAGYLPPEVALRRELRDAEALLAACDDPALRSRAARRLALLQSRLAAARGGRSLAVEDAEYRARVLARLGSGSD